MGVSTAIEKIYHLPLMELVRRSHEVHRENFKTTDIQASQLLSIKTGGCPENCSYCPQSAHFTTSVQKQSLMSVDEILVCAREAREIGATRFCMGAAWREVKDGPDFDQVLRSVREISRLGLEVCCTLGMINYEQAMKLKEAGLYAYNHNIDTSEAFYSEVITTRSFADRLETIDNVRRAGMTVCTGGILGLGESDEDRISFLHILSSLKPQPESVTINTLVRVPGTPLEEQEPLDVTVLVRVIAVARILMPKSMIRLSAGRNERTDMEQFLCFYVGANSIFLGEKLLTSANSSVNQDRAMLDRIGLSLSETNG